MQYREDRYGNKISQLGYGCMRFTKKGTSIDFDKAEEEILAAVEMGINYFDTAYIYPGNEECLGKIIAKNNLRDRIKIATKLPQYMMRTQAAIDKTFREELKRLNTDYIDYYLMHMFTDYSEWERLKELDMENWIASHKADGSIRQIGFSYHGDSDMFIKILNAYDWDFCQIQYNYLDENSQAGVKGRKAAAEKGIPVIIMEPLRGGKLVNLPEKAKKVLQDSDTKYTPAELGLRWLWNQPEVTCVLSGMNSMEMLEENVRIASNAGVNDFTDKEFDIIRNVVKIYKEQEKVGCTGCRYCMPCPQGVDIPANFYYYNLMYMEKKSSARFGFFQNTGLREKPGFASACIGCGKCELHCPQKINIRQELKRADKHLRPMPYRAVMAAARKFMLKKAVKKSKNK